MIDALAGGSTALSETPNEPARMLLLPLQIPVPSHLFGGQAFSMTLHAGLTVLLGPNGTGKTHVLRALKPTLQAAMAELGPRTGRRMIVRFLAAGRSAPFERYRGPSDHPNSADSPAAVGHAFQLSNRHGFESLTGNMLALQERADLRVKVEARRKPCSDVVCGCGGRRQGLR